MKKRNLLALLLAALLLLSACSQNASRRKSKNEKEDSAAADEVQQLRWEEDSLDDLAVLQAAQVGELLNPGVDVSIPGSWYKFSEDDDFIYLIYADYYRPNTLGMQQYDVTYKGYNVYGRDADLLVAYLLDENNWKYITESFQKLLPGRQIVTTGCPTKEQMEAVVDSYGIGSMFRPHTEVYDDCWGYWLATVDERGSNSVFGVRCLEYLAPIDHQFSTNGYGIRPLVAISKTKQSEPVEGEAYFAPGAWSELYRQFVEEETFLQMGQEYDTSAPHIFRLADVDADGTPELLISSGCSVSMGMYDYLYGIREGKVVFLQSFFTGRGSLELSVDEAYPGLFHTSFSDEESMLVSYYSLDHGEMVAEEVARLPWDGDVQQLTQDDALFHYYQEQMDTYISGAETRIFTPISFTQAAIHFLGWDTFCFRCAYGR